MLFRRSDNLWAVKKRDGRIYSNFSGQWIEETEEKKIDTVQYALRIVKSKKYNENEKSIYYDILLKNYKQTYDDNTIQDLTSEIDEDKLQENIKMTVATKLINFFKDFEFDPSFRFVNTLCYHLNSIDNACQYIFNYFNIADNQYKYDVLEKMKSYEFSSLIITMQEIQVSKKINSRLKIYYGPQAAGKTVKVSTESNNNIIGCNSAMLPSDLLEDFAFEDGKAGFHKSALWKAMEEGQIITLDEINLLPFESIRFLQIITDNKPSFIYKGQTINIKEGFMIIGTMNLHLGGTCYGLPEPLIDRASELIEFKLTTEQLVNAF